MSMFYLYILHSESFNKYYVGYTNDIFRRLEEHNSSKFNSFTHKYRPWILSALFQVSEDKGEAIKIERFIKKQKSRTLILQLINPSFSPSDKFAQLVRVPYLHIGVNLTDISTIDCLGLSNFNLLTNKRI